MPRRDRFDIRFAVGSQDGPRSSVWAIWTGKNQPDLYVAVRSQGGLIKATIHGPRDGKPSFGRHHGFAREAWERVPGAAQAFPSRHLASWPGAPLKGASGQGSVECRIGIPASSLRSYASSRGQDDVVWLGPPAARRMIEVLVVLGPQTETRGWPGQNRMGSQLLAEGRLADHRRFWIVYHYPSAEAADRALQSMIRRGSPPSLAARATVPGERVLTWGEEPDGSLHLGEFAADQLWPETA